MPAIIIQINVPDCHDNGENTILDNVYTAIADMEASLPEGIVATVIEEPIYDPNG